MIVVAENPATELVRAQVAALSAAGAFPIVEVKWADAPTAFVSVKPTAIVIAEPGPSPSESSARMLCLQIATAQGAIVPVIARTRSEHAAALPIASSLDAKLPVDRLIGRLRNAMRVRALHETVLRRIETFAVQGGILPEMPVGDALEDATVLVAGRGPLYPALGVAIGGRFSMVGALSVESAASQMNSRDIDGVVIGDGFSPKMIEAFLTELAQHARFRDIPVAVIGDVPPDLAEQLTNIDSAERDPARIVARMVPPVRMRAFEARLKRMLKSLESGGLFEPHTGLLTHDSFLQELTTSIKQSDDQGYGLALARFFINGPVEERAGLAGARHLNRLMRNIDFACRDQDGAIIMAFAQTTLREAHVVVRRIAGELKKMMLPADRAESAIDVTLTAFKGGDTRDSLMMRLMGDRAIAAE